MFLFVHFTGKKHGSSLPVQLKYANDGSSEEPYFLSIMKDHYRVFKMLTCLKNFTAHPKKEGQFFLHVNNNPLPPPLFFVLV